MVNFVPTEFNVGDDIVVVGYDPERADYDNRTGAIHGRAFYVYASDLAGHRRRLRVDTEAVGVSLATGLTARAAQGKLPVGWDRWDDYHPVYGSDAYGPDDEFRDEDEIAGGASYF